MRQISNLRFFEAIFIWSVRHSLSFDKSERARVRPALCRLLGPHEGSRALNALQNISLLIAEKYAPTPVTAGQLSPEEEVLTSAFTLAINKDEKNLMRIALEHLFLTQANSFAKELLIFAEALSRRHSCISTEGLINDTPTPAPTPPLSQHRYPGLTRDELLATVRIWVKAFMNDIDPFASTYNYLIKDKKSRYALPLHGFLEVISITSNKPIDINCTFCDNVSMDENRILAATAAGMSNDWEMARKRLIDLLDNVECTVVVESLKTLIVEFRSHQNASSHPTTNLLDSKEKSDGRESKPDLKLACVHPSRHRYVQ